VVEGESAIKDLSPLPRSKRVAVLMLATRFPRYVGDIGHPDTLGCDVHFVEIPSATVAAVIHGQSDTEYHRTNSSASALLTELIATAQHTIETYQPDLITTSCGFLYAYQAKIAAAIATPVVTSSLMWLERLRYQEDEQDIGILTFDREALLVQCLPEGCHYKVEGVPADSHFYDVIAHDKTTSDYRQLQDEVYAMALRMAAHKPRLVILECTNLRPFRSVIEDALRVPVHDLVDLLALSV